MKKLREEILKAQEILNNAKEEYIENPTEHNYEWFQLCEQYYKGLQKAFDLIEGE